MSERGARYERSFNGLIGAIIVTVVVVVGFVVFTGLFRDPVETELEDKDYLSTVGDLQEADVAVVYPADLPEGWRATDVRLDPGEDPRFELNLYTGDQEFVGLRQAADDVDDLLEEAGFDRPEEEDPLEDVGSVSSTWEGWSDEDGDRAYSTTVDDETVLVYGSLPAEDLADLVGRLTTDPLTDDLTDDLPSDPASPGPSPS